MKLKVREKLKVKKKPSYSWTKSRLQGKSEHILNSCIQIEELRVNHRVSVPFQVRFCLDDSVLSQIEQIINQERSLTISRSNLLDLKYYGLINSPLLQPASSYSRFAVQLSTLKRSHLTFVTDYPILPGQNSPALLRTVINLQGEIFQEIQQDLWSDKLLLERIFRAHNWLTFQVISQLSFRGNNNIAWLVNGISLMIATIIILGVSNLADLLFLYQILVFIGLFFSLKVLFQTVILDKIKCSIIYLLINTQLIKKRKIKRYFISCLGLISSKR